MNNLHRELAPVSAAAWAAMDDEARDVFKLRAAGRRVVEVPEPCGPTLAAINTGHLGESVSTPVSGATAHLREALPLVRVRVPFTVPREEIDEVERGALDMGWDSLDDAVAKLVDIEDTAILHGWDEAGIKGLTEASSNKPIPMPKDLVDVPEAISRAINVMRLADVEGPYDVVLPAKLYTQVMETSDQGYPILKHIEPLLEGGEIYWAPAAKCALVASRRGDDAAFYLGRDVSIGYLSHDADTATFYLEESFTLKIHQPEAAIAITN